MATVTGTLKDFTPQPLGVASQAQLVFTPTGPAGNAAKSLLVSRQIRVTPAADGSFTATLATYGSTNPSTAYRLRVEWFDGSGNYLSTEEIPWLVVVTGDGALVDFFANVQPGRLLIKGDKGEPGNIVQQAAIDALTAKDVDHDAELADHETRISAAATKNTEQDGRLGVVEAKQPVKCVRLESGAWVWDTSAGTHYVVPDADGNLIIHATAQPVPASTPVLNW